MSVSGGNWSFGQKREAVAQVGTVLAGLVIFVLTQTLAMSHEVPVVEKSITISLLDPPPEPKKIIEPPAKVEPPKPKKQIVQQPKVVTPIVAAPSVVKSEVVVPVVPVTPVVPAPIPEPKPEPQPVQRISNSAAEGAFAQDVRTRIERKKIYPDTARNLGMTGEVEVQYELDRTGKLLGAEIVASSGFKLLDKAAISAVKSASYKAFPEDAWLGIKSKFFRTKLVFSINE